MTIQTSISSQTFPGNGVTQVFPCNFRIFQDTDVVVTLVDKTTGITAETLVLGTDYTIAGAGDNAGFTLSTNVAIASTNNLLVARVIPYTQPTDFTNQGAFFPTMHEDMADRLAMQIQQGYGTSARAMIQPDGQTGTGQFFDGRSIRIGNLTAGINDNDASTVLQAREIAESVAAGIPGGVGTFVQIGHEAITRTFQDKMRDEITVDDYGARGDGATDASDPTQALKSNNGGGGRIPFVQASIPSTYQFNSLYDSDFDNTTLDVPLGVTLSLPFSSYRPLTDMDVARRTRIYWRDIKCDYYPSPKIQIQRDKTNFIGAGDLRQQKLIPINGSSDITYRKIAASGTDTFSSDSPTYEDSRSYSYSSNATGYWYGGFISARRGETYQAAVTVAGSGRVGVMFRHSGGYSVLASDDASPGSALMWRYIKPSGGSLGTAQDISFPGRGAYNSYNPQKALWGVTITDRGTAVITLNGRSVTSPVWVVGLGDIFEVGFVWLPSDGSSACSVRELMIERNTDPLGRSDLAEIRIFGDSTSDYILGMWQDDMRDMLDHTFGRKLGAISNFAVSGTNSYDVVASIAANGLGNAYYVVVAIGTNDIQGGADVEVSSANISSAIASIQGAGRIPIIVIPYMWYTQAQAISGRGQNSTNYDEGALLRARIARLCAETGAVMVDPTRELPEPRPEYVVSDPSQDPLVRDNIHQSALGYKLYAWAISRAIASHLAGLTRFSDSFCTIPAEWMKNSWTVGSSVGIWQSDVGLTSIQGNFAAGTKTTGTVIMNLPRWARPPVQQFFSVSSDGGYADVTVGTNGDVALGTVPGSFSVINLNNVVFHAA